MDLWWNFQVIYIQHFPAVYSLERRTERRGDAKSLCIQIAAHFHCVAGLAGVHILVLGGLHQQGVLALGVAHAFDALVVGEHEVVLPRVHVLPHLVVESDLGALRAHKRRTKLLSKDYADKPYTPRHPGSETLKSRRIGTPGSTQTSISIMPSSSSSS